MGQCCIVLKIKLLTSGTQKSVHVVVCSKAGKLLKSKTQAWAEYSWYKKIPNSPLSCLPPSLILQRYSQCSLGKKKPFRNILKKKKWFVKMLAKVTSFFFILKVVFLLIFTFLPRKVQKFKNCKVNFSSFLREITATERTC